MDGYDDTAVASLCNAVRFCFLCAPRNFIDWIGEERTRISSSFALADEEVFLHPEHSTEVLVESARTLALRTTGEESARLRLRVSAKYELILVSSAEGTGFAV